MENENIEKIVKKKIKEKVCKILFIRGNKYCIDFDGFGIYIEAEKINSNLKEIKIKYENEIGDPNFAIYI